MQIVSNGDNLHEMSNPVPWKNKKNISICHLLKILPRVLSINNFSLQKSTLLAHPNKNKRGLK